MTWCLEMFEKLDTNGKDLAGGAGGDGANLHNPAFRHHHPMLIVKLTVFGALTTKASCILILCFLQVQRNKENPCTSAHRTSHAGTTQAKI